MALTETQRLALYKHLGYAPKDVVLDPQIAAIIEVADQETELKAAITRCDTAYTAIQTVRNEADEFTSGPNGIGFSYATKVGHRQDEYQSARTDLARILGIHLEESGSELTGWRVQ